MKKSNPPCSYCGHGERSHVDCEPYSDMGWCVGCFDESKSDSTQFHDFKLDNLKWIKQVSAKLV